MASTPAADSSTCAPASTNASPGVRTSDPAIPTGACRAVRNRALVTARWEPSEGRLSTPKELSPGREAPKVVEPPPSRHMASTQPSSTRRSATCFMDAPTL